METSNDKQQYRSLTDVKINDNLVLFLSVEVYQMILLLQ